MKFFARKSSWCGRFAELLFVALQAFSFQSALAADDTSAPGDDFGAAKSVLLDEPALTESSGLAASRRKPERFWSHNDSGGRSRIFAFDTTGHKTGHCDLPSIVATDWEDIASFADHGVPRLLIADCGDNAERRSSISLHLLDEPDPDGATKTKEIQTLSVAYPDGPRDCEAVAVDQRRNQIILITKGRWLPAGIYRVPLPKRGEIEKPHHTIVAKKVGTLLIPMITAMDIDPHSGDIWVANYFHAFRFPLADRDQPLAQQLSRLPRPYALPRWKQIEAIAVDRSQHVWVTSEGSPAPMGRLRTDKVVALPATNHEAITK